MFKYIINKFYFVFINISPYTEVLMRKIYWNNISRTSRFRPKYRNNNINFNSINFDNIIDNLKNRGIGKGSIIIVHSSYDLLEISGLLPEEINSKLLELVGTEGTLVMPAIRKYKEEGNFEKHIKKTWMMLNVLTMFKKVKLFRDYYLICLCKGMIVLSVDSL